MARHGSSKGKSSAKHPPDVAPRSVADLTRRNVERVAALDAAAHAKATPADRAADAIAAFVGSMRFVWVSLVLVGVWVAVNVLLPSADRIDPFPFPLLTLALSVEAIFLSIFILMSQNRASHLSDRRSQLDLQLNVLSEQENTKMLEMLERIGQAVGATFEESKTLRMLEKATEPETLIEQIDQAQEASREKRSDKGRGQR